MSKPIPILITCVGGTMVPIALRWLADHSRVPFEVHGADVNDAPLAIAHLEKFHRIPMGEDKGYVDAMFSIAEREGIRVIVPWSDGEAFALAGAASRFKDIGCEILTSSAEVMSVIGDKLATYQALSAGGLAVPQHCVIDSADELGDVIERYGYPGRSVIVKPIDGRGGRGLFVLLGHDVTPPWLGAGRRERRLTEEEFSAIDQRQLVTGRTLVMPCLHEPVFDADVLAQNGTVQAVVIRRRHNPAGIPWTGNTICRNPKFEAYARKVTEILNLDGAHDIDLMSDDKGNPALLEVNPRMSGSMPATLMAGIGFLDAALVGRLGIELPVTLPDHDVEVLPDGKVTPK